MRCANKRSNCMSKGQTIGGLGRLVGVDHVTVMHWVRAHTDQLPVAPQPKQVEVAEQDELFTFIGCEKNEVYVRGGEIEPGERALTSWPVQNNKKLICPNQRLKQLVAARQGLFAAALSVEDVAQSTWLQAA